MVLTEEGVALARGLVSSDGVASVEVGRPLLEGVALAVASLGGVARAEEVEHDPLSDMVQRSSLGGVTTQGEPLVATGEEGGVVLRFSFELAWSCDLEERAGPGGDVRESLAGLE